MNSQMIEDFGRELSIEELTEHVNNLPFPAAQVGDNLVQYDCCFTLTENGWVYQEN